MAPDGPSAPLPDDPPGMTAAALREAAANPPPPSSRLAPDALAMLREEAAREIAARRAAPPPPDAVQTDLALPDPPATSRPVPDTPSTGAAIDDPVAAAIAATMAAAAQATPDPEPPPAPSPPPVRPQAHGAAATPPPQAEVPASAGPGRTRRERLPDIEEVNSTLRPQPFPPGYEVNAAPLPPMPGPSRGRGSFRAGFLLVVAVAILGLALYIVAPQIATAVPALKAPLDGYVAAVDAARVGLDDLLRSVIDRLQGLSTTAG
jgi:hypothetical protein